MDVTNQCLVLLEGTGHVVDGDTWNGHFERDVNRVSPTRIRIDLLHLPLPLCSEK